jgi:hypothetical protein
MGAYEVKKARAIALTVEGYAQKAIADALCVDTRTIRRWANEPDFSASLKEERESALALAQAHAASMYLADIEEGRTSNQFLVKIRDNPNLEVKTRMRAATCLMNQALKSTALMIKEEQANRTKADKTGHAAAPQASSLPAEPTSEEPAGAQSAPKSGQSRTEGDTLTPQESAGASPDARNVLAVPQDSRTSAEKPDESGQKRTSCPGPAIEELREKALQNCELHMDKLDHIDNLAQDLIKQGGDPKEIAELEKYRHKIEEAKVNLDGMIESLETFSPEELRSLLEKTGGQLFDLKIEMPKFKPKKAA